MDNSEIAYWVLHDKPLLDDDFILPGGELWASIGVEYGALSFPNARDLLKPHEFGLAFQNLDPGPAMNKLWENVTHFSNKKLRSLHSEKDKIAKIIAWAPGCMLQDPVQRTYSVYHPLIIETKNVGKNGERSWFLVGYDQDHGSGDSNRDWTALPSIDFLPEDKVLDDRRIIAGSAGLLVVDGGLQGSTHSIKLWGRSQIPNENFWRHPEIYKDSQSIVFVANPLTREYIVLPPIPGRILNAKIGKFIWRNKERTSYVLILIGWDTEMNDGNPDYDFPIPQKQKGMGEKIGLFVYCSQERCFTYCDEIVGRPLPFRKVGSSCIAIIGFGVFVGGVQITPKTKPRELDKLPCIYHFNISDSSNIKKIMIPFVVKGIHDSKGIEAPKVVQGGPRRVFAITRAISAATTFYLVEVILDANMQSFQGLHLHDTMPQNHFRKLCSQSPSNNIYEVSSCNGVISFKSNVKKSSVIILYDVNKEQWWHTRFPRQKFAKGGRYHLPDAIYEPNFLSRP